MLKYNMDTFADKEQLNKKELPKYSDTAESWWKHAPDYVESPQNTSLNEMTITRKYWAKPDLLKLHDTSDEAPPQDVLKKYIQKIRKRELPDPPQRVFKLIKPKDPNYKTQPKWTTIENTFVIK